jgi:hypothetical protein
MPGRPRAAGSRWETFARSVIAFYGDVCHLCGHGGARGVDHLIPQTDRPDLVYVMSNCRPVHGTYNRCPVCRQHCNQVRGGYSIERARRILAERAPKAEPPRKPKPDESGRPW